MLAFASPDSSSCFEQPHAVCPTPFAVVLFFDFARFLHSAFAFQSQHVLSGAFPASFDVEPRVGAGYAGDCPYECQTLSLLSSRSSGSLRPTFLALMPSIHR